MTRKFLNPLAADLRIERLNAVRFFGEGSEAVEAVDRVIDAVIDGLKRANPRVDRERFWAAVKAA